MGGKKVAETQKKHAHIAALMEARTTTVKTPISGWKFRIRRADPYEAMERGQVAMGSLLQNFSKASAALQGGQVIDDEVATLINADMPDSVEVARLLLCACVIKADMGKGWKPIHILPNDTPAEELQADPDALLVDQFVTALAPEDLSELQDVIWDFNGLGRGIARILGPFRGEAGGAAIPDVQDSGVPSDGTASAH